MKHRASAKFWRFYEQLPADIQGLADKNFALLKSDPSQGSLNFKKVGQFGPRALESITAQSLSRNAAPPSGFGLAGTTIMIG